MLIMKVRRFLVVAAQVVKPGHHSNIIVKLDSTAGGMLPNLFNNELEELASEVVVFADHGRLELIQVNVTTTVLVHHQKILILFIQITIEIVELIERNLTIAILVVL